MSGRFKRSLKPAHFGYLYQDLITAYVLAEGLVHYYDGITVDKKVVEDDRIDDLEVVHAGYCKRFQIKSSQDDNRRLQTSDFTNQRSSLRIDRLVRSYLDAGNEVADEYRLCATWQVPNETALLNILEPVTSTTMIEGGSSRIYRLRADQIWPNETEPLWAWLGNDGVTRQEFVAFCDRFLIELELPQASNTLNEPGPLEKALLDLLIERVGIGRYPNQYRRPQDVAALLIAIASLARAKESTLTPTDVEVGLNLRADYGRISQEFPLNEQIFQDRNSLRPSLIEVALHRQHQIVIGPPGSGKSWELTKLASQLEDEGFIVARHYCYLEPGDQFIEQRITSDVFFGNLLAELTDAEPSLREGTTRRYSAGPSELEEILEKATQLDKSIILVVDGLDHISRVLAGTPTVSDIETDIIDQLATLNIPEGVALVIGSQPGEHLEPLREAFSRNLIEVEVEPWSASDVRELAGKLGVDDVLTQHKVENREMLLDMLAEKSEGSPLYATYLSRELKAGLFSGVITTPQDWLQEIPVIAGDIAAYYDYLYRYASQTGRSIADVLSVIDFAVTETDLREILPPLLHDWIPDALRHLNPILTNVSTQGGLRIFHESFRRFMNEEVIRQGRSLTNVLDPVINWLQYKGFFQNAKSYRFLLPALRRADRVEEALQLINVDFVSKSVANGHSFKAVERNLALTADMAARTLRWPHLIQCIELNRAAYTCYEDKLFDPVLYWKTYLNLFGPAAVAERLLFDGKTTQKADVGLVLCSLTDDAGETPPWREYLTAYSVMLQNNDDQNNGQSEQEIQWEEQISLARVHGLLRIEGFERIADSILQFLLKYEEQVTNPAYIRSLASRMTLVTGRDAIDILINWGTKQKSSQPKLARSIIGLLQLGLADGLKQTGDIFGAKESAASALPNVNSPEFAISCVELDAPITEATEHAHVPSSLDLSINSHPDNEAVWQIRQWISSLRLLVDFAPSILQTERERIVGDGWYPCWLRFAIGLVEVEAAKRQGSGTISICAAFDELIMDMRPFAGKPRACDLYYLRDLIRETLKWGISLLITKEEWLYALDVLQRVRNNISTTLDNEPAGPIYLADILEILTEYAADPELAPIILSHSQTVIERDKLRGTYFEFHAEHNMRYACIQNNAGARDVALSIWKQVSVYLSGYGYRKDITIYEIIDSIPALTASSQTEATKALVASQPLADAVRYHTDGRETKRAPLAWFESFLECDTSAALALLSQSMSTRDATIGWPTEDALISVLQQVIDSANPVLVDALCEILPFHVEYEGEAERRVKERLDVVSRLLDQDRSQGETALYRLAAQVTGDSRRYTDDAKEIIQVFAEEHNIPLPQVHNIESKPREQKNNTHSTRERILKDDSVLFPPNASFIEMITRTREISQSWWNEEERNKFVNSFGYRLIELLQQGHEENVIRLIRFFAREYGARDDNIHPLGEVAEGLERLGYDRVAGIAYVLAYVGTYGGGGYLSLGGQQHEYALLRGLELSQNEALKILAGEIAYKVRQGNYNGITRHFIERFAAWGDAETARNCWWAAYSVIKYRLPTTVKRDGWFVCFDPEQTPTWSVDEGLVAIIFGRLNHPVLARKTAALYGLGRIIGGYPEVVPLPLRRYLTVDTPITSMLVVLDTLLLTEEAPYSITTSISDLLVQLTSCELWGVRALAHRLLKRVGIECEIVSYPPPKITIIDPSPEQSEMLYSIDSGNRFEHISAIWPDFSRLVTQRIQQMLDDAQVHKERIQSRLRLAYGRDGETLPPTPVLFWQNEILETAFHEVLNGLTTFLWQTGERNEEIDLGVMDIVLPNIVVHAGLHASRSARPSYPDPISTKNGRQEVLILENDPLYPNWYRLGYYERQCWQINENSYGPPTDVTSVFAGVIIEPKERLPHKDDFPFRDSDVMNWWVIDEESLLLPFSLPVGPLTSLTRHIDWLGDALVIIPPPRFIKFLNLRPAEVFAPMTWNDEENNKPGIVLRTWKIRDSKQFHAEPLEYEGSDIIIRPDLYQRLMNNLLYANVCELCVVSRAQIPMD